MSARAARKNRKRLLTGGQRLGIAAEHGKHRGGIRPGDELLDPARAWPSRGQRCGCAIHRKAFNQSFRLRRATYEYCGHFIQINRTPVGTGTKVFETAMLDAVERKNDGVDVKTACFLLP